MQSDELLERNPMRAVAASIGGGLLPGQVGGVFARAGVGKSAFLIHVGLHALLRNGRVLHVSFQDAQERVRSFYDEIFSAVARNLRTRERATMAVSVERHRVIHSALGRELTPAGLGQLIQTLRDVMEFKPEVVVIDGFDGVPDVSAWSAVAEAHGACVWMAIQTHGSADIDIADVPAAVTTAVALSPLGSDVELQLLRQAGDAVSDVPALHLDPVTMLLRPEDVSDPMTQPPTSTAATCTMFAGGSPGAEQTFGEIAERYGVNEVNFAWPGQASRRERGRRELSQGDLRRGDVSLKYVSHHLGRNWTDVSLKHVLQVQWHIAENAQQLFVVGTIMDNGVVHGGTGWSVELCRRQNKAVWVYDQERDGWFFWDGDGWTPGMPIINTPLFGGTGTLHLTDAGKRAVEDLFARSFGPAPIHA